MYNRIAREYAERWLGFSPPHRTCLLDTFVSLLPEKEGPVLDAGCGPGRDLKLLWERGVRELYGIDLSEEMCNIARNTCPEAEIMIGDVRELSFLDAFFSGVICSGVLLHLPKKDVKRALREFNRVTREKGMLLVAVKEGRGESGGKRREDGVPVRGGGVLGTIGGGGGQLAFCPEE